MSIHVSRFPSPIGELAVAVDETGALVRLEFLSAGTYESFLEAVATRAGGSPEHSPERCARVRDQLAEYFAGERRDFDLPLRLEGTDFQLAVWKELTRIPYGSTRTYGEIAARIGSPRASRAVGQSNHVNPIPIVEPCHRVVGADGTLTGFGGGLPAKQALLDLERGAGPLFAP